MQPEPEKDSEESTKNVLQKGQNLEANVKAKENRKARERAKKRAKDKSSNGREKTTSLRWEYYYIGK